MSAKAESKESRGSHWIKAPKPEPSSQVLKMFLIIASYDGDNMAASWLRSKD